MVSKTVDPITFEVIHNGLDSLVEEMALTVMRTAHSGIVKDAMAITVPSVNSPWTASSVPTSKTINCVVRPMIDALTL